MIYEQPFVPLLFDEDDTDLWNAIKKISPEKRSQYIKNLLREVIINLNSELFNQDNYLVNSEITFSDNEINSNSISRKKILTEIASSNDHGKCNDLNRLTLDSLLLNIENQVEPTKPNPLEYILNEIIGSEEDQEVINALTKAKNESDFKDTVSIQQEQSSVELPEDNVFESIPILDTTVQDINNKLTELTSSAIPYLFQTIIGEEDDEEIIRLIKQKQKAP